MIASAANPRYGKLQEFMKADGLSIYAAFDTQLDANQITSMAKTTALSLLSLADHIQSEEYDGVLVIADRHETIAASIAGAYLGKTVFHIQGGEITGNIDNKVRFANSHLSDFHFVSTAKARERLILSGIQPEKVFVTGCPSLDLVGPSQGLAIIEAPLLGIGIDKKTLFENKFLVVLQHAETTSSLTPRDQIMPTIMAINEVDIPTLWIWPNSDWGGEEIVSTIRRCREEGKLSNVHFERSLDSEIFLAILNKASCIVGNSSVAIRESSLLGIPAVNIGGRQANREYAENVLHSDYSLEGILAGIHVQTSQGRFPPDYTYGRGNSGPKIKSLIEELL